MQATDEEIGHLIRQGVPRQIIAQRKGCTVKRIKLLEQEIYGKAQEVKRNGRSPNLFWY